MEYRDYLLREIKIGDNVVFILPGSGGLQLGKVTKLTPKNVRIDFIHSHGYLRGKEISCVRPPHEVVKVDGPDLTAYLLKK